LDIASWQEAPITIQASGSQKYRSAIASFISEVKRVLLVQNIIS
jgi:hypothetical protein